MARISFLVDGFNLYHALDQNPQYRKYKWISLLRLAQCYVRTTDTIVSVNYFTAYATWNPLKVGRHKLFVSIQEHEGVNVVLGEFKRKDKHCQLCRKSYMSYEEKQTDVNIALNLFTQAILNEFDHAIIISGDTDLLPAVRSVQSIFPSKQIGVVIPIGRSSEHFKKTANFHHKMKEAHLKSSLLNDPYDIAGTLLQCPPTWK
jgi:uncharacterized LabA/DUF88 family protein